MVKLVGKKLLWQQGIAVSEGRTGDLDIGSTSFDFPSFAAV
jgi:hypothetical protein